jgi:hypothetical protein
LVDPKLYVLILLLRNYESEIKRGKSPTRLHLATYHFFLQPQTEETQILAFEQVFRKVCVEQGEESGSKRRSKIVQAKE